MAGEHFDSASFIFKRIPETQFKEWSMVAIRDSPSPNTDSSVFPPINHENLHRPSQPDQKNPDPLSPSPSSPLLSSSSSSPLLSSSSSSPLLSSSSSSSLSSFSPSDSDVPGPVSPLPSVAQVRKPGEFSTWVGIGFGLLRSRLSAVASSSGFDKVWSFASGAGMAGVVFVLCSLFLRARRRRYRNRLMLIGKEKDEKINKLLHQIAQMNEVLVARHRVLASKLAN